MGVSEYVSAWDDCEPGSCCAEELLIVGTCGAELCCFTAGGTWLEAVDVGVLVLPNSFSAVRALSTSFATSVACAFFSVFLTNPVISTLHFRSTSSRIHSPSFGTSRPSSATSLGSPGKLPPSAHLFLISTPSGANTCVCSPAVRSWKQAV